MTNRIAVVLGVFLIFVIIGDVVFGDSRGLIYAGRKFFDLILWIKIWR